MMVDNSVTSKNSYFVHHKRKLLFLLNDRIEIIFTDSATSIFSMPHTKMTKIRLLSS